MPINPIQHGSFTFDDEKILEIAKSCEVMNLKKSVLGQFTSPNASINGDQLVKRRQVLLDPAAVANLDEGDTPREDQIKIVTFAEDLRSFGSFITFTRHAKARNRDDIVEQARRQLGHNRLYDIEAVRFIAMNSTSYSVALVTSPSLSWWDTLTNARVRLQKNGAKPPFAMFCPPEVEASIAKEAKAANTLIQSTAEGVELFKNGYVGKYAGFELVSCSEAYMYDGVNYKVFFIGHTEGGQWPIVENKLGEGNIEAILHDIGDGGHQDPTNETGSIALRIDYVGAFLEHPECLLKLTGATTSTVSAKVVEDVPAAYKIEPHADSHVKESPFNPDGVIFAGKPLQYKLAVAVVKAADGTSIASPTVAIKVGSSTGDAVSAGADGKYTLTAGQKYYFSVQATNYTTKTGLFVADPANGATMTVELAAS